MTRRVVIREIVIDGVEPGQERAVAAAVRAAFRQGLAPGETLPTASREVARVNAPGAGPGEVGRATLAAVLSPRTR